MKKLYVGNLAFSATESDLREMFAAFGAVETASLVTERDTGRSRGFGFVEMTNDFILCKFQSMQPPTGRTRLQWGPNQAPSTGC